MAKGRTKKTEIDIDDDFSWEYFKKAEWVYNRLKAKKGFLKDLERFLIWVGKNGGIDRVGKMSLNEQLSYLKYIDDFYRRWGIQKYAKGGLGFDLAGVEFYPSKKPFFMKLIINKDVGVKNLVNALPFYMGLRNAVLRNGKPIKKGKSEEGFERNCGMYAYYHSPEIAHRTEQERLQKVKDRFMCGYLSDERVKHIVHDKKRYSRQ